MAGNRAKEVESGPAVADGAALFGHGNGRAYHGPSTDFVPLTNDYVDAASQPEKNAKSKFGVTSRPYI